MQKVDKMYTAFTGLPYELVQLYTDRHTFMSPIEVRIFSFYSLAFLFYPISQIPLPGDCSPYPTIGENT